MDVREALEKAASTAAETETTATQTPEVGETTTTEPVEVATEAAPVETPAEAKVRARDEGGRFTKTTEKAAGTASRDGVHGAASATPPAAQGKADGATTSPAPSASPASVKAPQSWSPQAREAFAKAPPEVQREVERREREITRTLSETAQARKVAESVTRTLQPFETLARANGMDSMQYAGSVLQTAAALQMGAPGQKAAIVASLINTYGIDLDAINQALQGQPQAHPQQHQPSPVDVEQIIERRLQAEEAKRAQQANVDAAQAFLAAQPEFIEHVMPDMTEILRLDRARGGNMTPQQAYDRAIKLNPDVQEVLAQRKAAEAARTRQEATARTAAAASSVRSTPAAAPTRTAQPKSIREVLEMKDAELSGRV